MTEAKRIPAIEATINDGTLILLFAHGEELRINADDLSPEIQRAAMMHGLKQKLVDAAAIARDTTTGRTATIETKFEAIQEVHARLLAGEWNKAREGGAALPKGGLFVAALVELRGGDRAAVDAWLAGLTKDQIQAVRGNHKIKAKMAEIKLRNAAQSVDVEHQSDALLGELGI